MRLIVVPALNDFFCPPVLRLTRYAGCLLHWQALYERVSYQVGNRASSPSSSEAEPSVLSTRGAVSHTKEILQSTNRATRAALSHLSDSKWWRQTLSSLRPKPRANAELDDLNVDLHRIGCHPFYEGLHTNCYVNKVIASL